MVSQISDGQPPALPIRDLIQILRPTQWSKNAVLLAALIFARRLFVLYDVCLVAVAFGCFCCLASGAYVMNDLRDCERDRQHPLKSLRPLPAGRIRKDTAVRLSLSLMGAGLFVGLLLGQVFFTLAALYLVLQVAYTFVLKDTVILDVMAI